MSKYAHSHNSALTFISQISADSSRVENEFFISNLVNSEVFSAVRTELIPFVMYGKDISMGNFCRKNQYNTFPDEDAQFIGRCVHESIGSLMDSGLSFFNDYFQDSVDGDEDNEVLSSSQKAYWTTFQFLLLNVAGTNTQDAILLGTAIANEAHYFVTDDRRLIDAANKYFLEKRKIRIFDSTKASAELMASVKSVSQ